MKPLKVTMIVLTAMGLLSAAAAHGVLGGVQGGDFSRDTVNASYGAGIFWSHHVSANATVTLVPDGGSPAPSNYAQLQVVWYPRAARLWYVHYAGTPVDQAWALQADLTSAPGRDGCDRIFGLRTQISSGIFSPYLFSMNIDYVNNWIDWVAGSHSDRIAIPDLPRAWTTAVIKYDPVSGAAIGKFGDTIVFNVITEPGLTGNTVFFDNSTNSSTWDTGTFGVDNVSAYAVESIAGLTVLLDDRSGVLYTDADGVDSLRVVFSEPVVFSAADVAVADSSDNPVAFTVAGSETAVMTINFTEPARYDVYTVTLKDSIVTVADGTALDGNLDWEPGGDALLTFEHRRQMDLTNDNVIDLDDFAQFVNEWMN